MVRFLYAGGFQISDGKFVAAWKRWFETHNRGVDWRVSCMRRGMVAVTLQEIVNQNGPFCLDVLCRIIVRAEGGSPDTMQAVEPFMTANAHLIIHCDAPGRHRSVVKGAKLKDFQEPNKDDIVWAERNINL